mmetsp:Transcript_31113/g.77804  ORF Transcript_31113/g.77804 Transcript_31113/m.77804 type:complete len:220 (-) Transcript_31113:19-678(-)
MLPLPSSMERGGHSWQEKKKELNLKYVAFTRATRSLRFLKHVSFHEGGGREALDQLFGGAGPRSDGPGGRPGAGVAGAPRPPRQLDFRRAWSDHAHDEKAEEEFRRSGRFPGSGSFGGGGSSGAAAAEMTEERARQLLELGPQASLSAREVKQRIPQALEGAPPRSAAGAAGGGAALGGGGHAQLHRTGRHEGVSSASAPSTRHVGINHWKYRACNSFS